MTSRSIYMQDIKASGPACHPPNRSEVLQLRLTGHPGVAVMTRHITKPTPLPVVVKWPRSWTGRSNHHFARTLVKALSPLEENLTPGYSLLPFFFCTDKGKVGESVMLLYFHSKYLLFAKHRPIPTACSFPVFIVVVVSFQLIFVCQFIVGSWSTRQRVAGGQPTGDSNLQEASTDQ